MPQTSLGTTEAGLAQGLQPVVIPPVVRDDRHFRSKTCGAARRPHCSKGAITSRSRSSSPSTNSGRVRRCTSIPTRRCSSCRPARPPLLSVTTSSSSPEPTSWSFRHRRLTPSRARATTDCGGDREPKRHRRADEPLDAGSARGRRLLGTHLPTAALWLSPEQIVGRAVLSACTIRGGSRPDGYTNWLICVGPPSCWLRCLTLICSRA